MLDQIRTGFVGNTRVNVTATGEMLDIGRRLVEGDPTCGFAGAPDLTLHLAIKVDPVTGDPDERCNKHKRRPCRSCEDEGDHPYLFEVWGIDAHNQPYLALSWPRCDASLIKRLTEIDNRYSDIVDRSAKIALAAQRRIEAEQAEQRGEAVEKMAFALRKDLGHHHGGLTKSLH